MQVVVNKNKYIVLSKEHFQSKEKKDFYKMEIYNKSTKKSTELFVTKAQYDKYEEMVKEYEFDVSYSFDGKYNAKIIESQ